MQEAERLGYDSRLGRGGLRLRRGDDPRLAGRADRAHQARLGDLPDARPLAGDDRDDRGHAGPALGRPHAAGHRLERPAGGRGLARRSASASSSSARASTSRWCGWRSRASGSSSTARRLSCRCPTAPARRSSSRSPRSRSGSRSTSRRSGPKNTELAAEIADGWLPMMFSPEHVAEFRPLLEEGFARAGGGKGSTTSTSRRRMQRLRHRRPSRRARRDAPVPRALRRRHGLARQQLLQRARRAATGSRTRRGRVQDLYLEGKREEAAAALPDELIDTVTLCGPRDAVRERLGVLARRRRRHADGLADGVDVRGSPRAAARGRRAARGEERGSARRLRRPGHAFPMLALGSRLVERGHVVAIQTWRRWRADLRGGRDAVRRRARVPGVPDAGPAPEALRRGGAGGDRDASRSSARSRRTSPCRTS